MRELTKDDLTTLVYGATFLASGGGGSFSAGLSLANNFPDGKTVRVVSVEEAAADGGALSTVTAYIGAPQAIADLKQPSAAIYAVKRLNALCGGNIRYIVPVEIGGLSSLVAATVAAALDLPVVDADGAGRAVPTLTMTTFGGAGLSGNPSVFDNEKDEAAVFEIDSVADVEAIGRPLLAAPAYDSKAGLAMWPMTAGQLKKALPIRGTLDLCLQLGALLRYPSADPVNDLLAKLEQLGRQPYRLAEGKVCLEGETTQGGFDFGKVSFKDGQGKPVAYTYNQNETLIGWSTGLPRPLVIGPDLACYVTKKGQPFSNDDINPPPGTPGVALRVQGEDAVLIGMVADSALTGNAEIMAACRASLIGLGYAGSYVPLDQLQGL